MDVSIDPKAAAQTSTIGALPVGLKLGWSFGAFGSAILVNGIAVFIFFYMVGILKIEPAIAGTIVFLTKIIDVITDPLMGIYSDRFQSPRGRRRPFLPIGAVISGLSLVMIFSTPMFAQSWVTALYVFVALTLYTIGYTIFNVPYMTMPVEMTDSYHERSSIHGYRIVMITIASFVATAVAPYVVEKLGRTEWTSYAVIGFVGAAIVTTTMMIAYMTTASARWTSKGSTTQSALLDFRMVFGSRHFMRLISVKLAQLIGFQTTQAALLFFILQSLGLGFDILLLLGAVTAITSVIATPVILRIAKRYGKRTGYYVSAGVTILVAISWSFASKGEPDWALALRAAGSGIAFSGNVMMAMSMLTDIVRYEGARTGIQSEGVFVAMYSFVEKLTAAIGPFIIGIILSAVGFNKDLPPDVSQGANVENALLFAVSWLPAAMGIVAIAVLRGYNLTEEHMAQATGKEAG